MYKMQNLPRIIRYLQHRGYIEVEEDKIDIGIRMSQRGVERWNECIKLFETMEGDIVLYAIKNLIEATMEGRALRLIKMISCSFITGSLTKLVSEFEEEVANFIVELYIHTQPEQYKRLVDTMLPEALKAG